jgi:hypothetical protein
MLTLRINYGSHELAAANTGEANVLFAIAEEHVELCPRRDLESVPDRNRCLRYQFAESAEFEVPKLVIGAAFVVRRV